MSKLLLSEKESERIWNDSLQLIRKQLSDRNFKTWVEPIRLLSFDGSAAVLVVPDKFYGEWIEDHFKDVILEALSKETDAPITLHYQVQKVALPEEQISNAPKPGPALSTAAGGPTLKGSYTFDDFVVGPGNRFAHAAALAVSETPGKNYNPLFIYGSVGLGKTHLMRAIANSVKKKFSKKKVCFISSEKFTNHLIAAIQTRSTKKFRDHYRSCDLLLIDDIHFIAGKEATQEEFFHTFNALYDSHNQIVVTSDRPPRDIPALEERLVSRFGWGLVTDIQRPEFETRVAILKKKMEKETVVVPDDVVYFLAEKIKSNIRELEGALIRVVAYASLTATPITLPLAQDILKDAFTEEESKITIDLIQKKVSEEFQVRVSDLRNKNRSRAIALPRQIAMYLIRDLTAHSLFEIGEFFGGRNHATVLHACQKIKAEVEKDPSFRQIVDKVVDNIRSNSY